MKTTMTQAIRTEQTATSGYVGRFLRERQEAERLEREYAVQLAWYQSLSEEQRRAYHVQLNSIYC